MTAPANSQNADRDAALTREGKMLVAQRRADRALIVALNNEAWGSAMSPAQRSHFAEYMRRNRLDISEVDNLGGRPYRNGRYYERRIAEMRTRGVVEWSEGDHIGPDPRLEKLAESSDEESATWAKKESARRLRERIRWAVPEDATHAYVVRVKLKTDGKVLEGCDWITPLRTKNTRNGPKIADPVGAEEPEKTVITRAWRRAGLLVAAEIPELKSEEEILDAEAEIVEETIATVGQEEAEREEANRREPQQLAAPTPGDPYGENATAAQPRDAEKIEAKPSAVNAQPTRFSKADLFAVPFGDAKGKPLHTLEDADLANALAWARRNDKYPEFISAAEQVLEDRRTADA